ncbi:hypothetical protein EPUS_04336 [Endocarpon pusillum Z07020]|uniref:Uncharacterized protein n=1 Tax=Endocarpon pusillum (strain Z07020 / HMAS-L-300199) TaxID=1263415 RepID=U1I2Q7_ENDPU|nr:uncharacterized protein EPUS_04336 [Endocarpon pusillum Z07020]ERF76259.1 hypothetical protein EPUS_04336 [Endocarpon pusillum Z07020]
MAREQKLSGDNIVLLPQRSEAQGDIALVRHPSESCPIPRSDRNSKPFWRPIERASGLSSADREAEEERSETKKKKSPCFRRLEWSDPQLGTLGVLPDELVIEICKYLVPQEVPGTVFEGNCKRFRGARKNILHFMQASSRLYWMARDLECFGKRTYNFAVSGLGFSFEGHRDCPSRVIKAALKNVESVKVTVEIDLDRMADVHYMETLVVACRKIAGSMQHVKGTEERLQTYDIDIWLLDSRYVPGKPSHPRTVLSGGTPDPWEGHIITIDNLLRKLLKHLVGIQNIRVGNVQLLALPLTYHFMWNASTPLTTYSMAIEAQARWRRVQAVVDAGAYLLSGWDMNELKWCTEFLKMSDFTGYYTRAECMSKLEPPGSQRPPVYDRIVRSRCRCSPICWHI